MKTCYMQRQLLALTFVTTLFWSNLMLHNLKIFLIAL